MQDKTPRNKKGQRHGHWDYKYEEYNNLKYNGYLINGIELGFHQWDGAMTRNKYNEYYAR